MSSVPTIESTFGLGGTVAVATPLILPNVAVGSGNKIVVAVSFGRLSRSMVSMTRDGQSFTSITGGNTSSDNGAIRCHCTTFYLDNPNAGTHDIIVNYSGSSLGEYGIVAWVMRDAVAGQPHAVGVASAISATPVAASVVTSIVDCIILDAFVVGRDDTVSAATCSLPQIQTYALAYPGTSTTHAQKMRTSRRSAPATGTYGATWSLTGTPNRTAQVLLAIQGTTVPTAPVSKGINIS